MKPTVTIKLAVTFLLMAGLLILAGCGETNKPDQNEDAEPLQTDFSATEPPQINKEAFRGQGRLAFIGEDRLNILNGDDGTLTILNETDLAGKPQWSPDGEWLAYLGGENQLRIVKADGNRAQEVTGLPVSDNTLKFTWLPNDNMLAVNTFTEGEGIYLVRPGEAPCQAIRGDTPISFIPAWSPDGKTIAYVKTLPYDESDPVSRSDALYVAPADEGEPSSLYTAESAGIIIAGWSPDGKDILFWVTPQHSSSSVADGLQLFSLPLTGGKPNPIATTLLHSEWQCWSPDGGKLMAVAGIGREIWYNKYLIVYDAQTGKCTELPRQPDTVSLYPDWSPDGNRISYLQAEELGRDPGSNYAETVAAWKKTWSLWIADADGTNARRLDEAGAGIEYALWSRDSAHLLYLKENTIWLINATGGNPVKIVDLKPGQQEPCSYYGYTAWADQFTYFR